MVLEGENSLMKPCMMQHEVVYREVWENLPGSIPSQYTGAFFNPSGSFCALTRLDGCVDLWDFGSYPVCLDTLQFGEEAEVEPSRTVVAWDEQHLACIFAVKRVTKSGSGGVGPTGTKTTRYTRLKCWFLDLSGSAPPAPRVDLVLPVGFVKDLTFHATTTNSGRDLSILALVASTQGSSEGMLLKVSLSTPTKLCEVFEIGGAAGGRNGGASEKYFEPPLDPWSEDGHDNLKRWYVVSMRNANNASMPSRDAEVTHFLALGAARSNTRVFTLCLGMPRESNDRTKKEQKSVVLCRYDAAGCASTVLAPNELGSLKWEKNTSVQCLDINNTPPSSSSNGAYYNLSCSCIVLVATGSMALLIDGDNFTVLRRLGSAITSSARTTSGGFGFEGRTDAFAGVGFTGMCTRFDRPDPVGPVENRVREEDPSTIGIVVAYNRLATNSTSVDNNRLYFWRPFAPYSTLEEKPNELSLAPAFPEVLPPPAPDGLDPVRKTVDVSVMPSSLGMRVVVPSCRSIIVAIDRAGDAYVYWRRMTSSFPGISYPPGYEYIMRVTSYVEREDELDEEVRNPSPDGVADETGRWGDSAHRSLDWARRGGVSAAESCLHVGNTEGSVEHGDNFQGRMGHDVTLEDHELAGGHVVRLLHTKDTSLVPSILPLPKAIASGEKHRDILKRRNERLHELSGVIMNEGVQTTRLQAVRDEGIKRADDLLKRQRAQREKFRGAQEADIQRQLELKEGMVEELFRERQRRRLLSAKREALTVAASSAQEERAAIQGYFASSSLQGLSTPRPPQHTPQSQSQSQQLPQPQPQPQQVVVDVKEK